MQVAVKLIGLWPRGEQKKAMVVMMSRLETLYSEPGQGSQGLAAVERRVAATFEGVS